MKQTIIKSSLPHKSIINDHTEKIDYQDSFMIKMKYSHLSIKEIYINIFAHSPKWIERLLKIRNTIVKPFGIKVNKSDTSINNIQVGLRAGIFKIFAIQNNEIIAGEDDKHLNFRISIYTAGQQLTLSTVVTFNNWFGKIYFSIIKPFHKSIVKAMLSSAIKNNRL